MVGLVAANAVAQTQPLEIDAGLKSSFRFVAYGDTRFTDPANTTDANPEVRQKLVQAIAKEHPAFISFGGDIPLTGSSTDDWKVYDLETSIWREKKIPVFPAMGNHELKGDQKIGLQNYFQRFPALHEHRYYSVKAGRCLLLSLDSSLDETIGEQGDWLAERLKNIGKDIDFVFIALHHPPVSSAGDKTDGRGGNGPRPQEQKLAAYIEEQQKTLRARIIVFGSHVHNYERHEHGGVTYFVTGGGGAHAYPISRAPNDPYQSQGINYHFILFEVKGGKLKTTMKRLEINDGVDKWTMPDSITITSTPKNKR
jgi:Icc-related predicted phosphoesterase